ncbi:MAG: efflux RND transporter periplasmic adaptor subunit [Ignavibacteriales bacterium]|nr:efflux RND transporter periplasmic adaptor subunit [Ignavibacteriales bacterium]
MKRTRKLFVVLTLLVVLAGCTRQEDRSGSSSEKRAGPVMITLTRKSVSDINVQFVSAEVQPLRKEFVIAARLTAHQDHEAQVGTMVQGKVSKVMVNLGDRVEVGQELMEIEGVEIGEIKARFIKAKAHLAYTEAGLKRQQSLMDQNIGAQKSLLEAQADFEKARAEFAAEDRRIHSVGLNDEDVEKFIDNSSANSIGPHIGGILPVKSPIAGVVFERNVVIGQLLDPATTAFKIINTSTLWVDGQVHEGDVSMMRGLSEITIVVPYVSGSPIRGRLLYIGATVDQQTRMVKVRAVLQNSHGALKPGMFAEMHVPVGDGAKEIVIPGESLIRDGTDQYVFVAVNDTTFEKRDVVPGLASGDWVQVKNGLSRGERVVTKGSFMLKSELKKEMFGEGE